jgi:hypothetical protein
MMANNAQLWRSAETAAQARLALSHPSTESTMLTNSVLLKVRMLCCKKSTNADQSPLELQFPNPSRTTLAAFTATPLATCKLFTQFLLSATVLRMAKSSGLSETHGVLTGVNKVSSVFAEVQTILLLRAIATGPLQLTPGLNKSGTLPLRPKKRTQRTTKLSIHSPNQFMIQPRELILSLLQRRISSFNLVRRTMVVLLLSSLMES